MSDFSKCLGRILDYDPKTDVIIFKADFLDPDNQAIIEDIFVNKRTFTFLFRKPFRRMKTYAQLKKYFQLLKQIFIKNDIVPEAEAVKSLDIEIKKSCLPCKKIIIQEKEILLVPSKADLDVDQMSFLLQEVMDRYGIE